MKDIARRLAAVEALALTDTAFCMVALPDGSEVEVDVEEWYQRRQEWRFLRMTKGADNTCLHLLFAAWSEEAGALDDAEREESKYFRRASG